jgi:hypothetical protein|uniref:DUF6072 family protein n=1 Tax=Orrella sp. TaxID=1921583 RepID=UPI0040475265
MTSESVASVEKLSNGAKLLGETIVPGASLLMDGKFANGAAHAAVGLGAKMALGPVGVLLVCADSFSKSTTDKFLWDHLAGFAKTSWGKLSKKKPVDDVVNTTEMAA